ncbi:threonine/serine exporter family protein [Paenibacillus sp. 1001270B_150601_E10]|uniref:threonine/serine exporter family protein n=1 Tax=Paenibacillus sp. 1001270B_150601_E10 TaxID=2787079 RepID=UPI00189E3137|nr:threonine/serine exporter family protein [Paenibacillus sp. 1001270B_150601_E10]
MEASRIIYVATYAGKIMLESGGETYRVEDTINRICQAYGIKQVDSFVVPTAIITSAVKDDFRSKTVIKRIKHRSFNLQKIVRVNELSRAIVADKLSVNEAYRELKEIEQMQGYPLWLSTLFYALISAAYTIFFGASVLDALGAFVAGAVMRLVLYPFEKGQYNVVFIHVIGGVAAAIGIVLLTLTGWFQMSNMMLISVLMNLFPGLIMANALRDIMAGDFLSGMSRVSEALLIAIAIAVGSGSVIGMSMSLFGSDIL